MRFHTHTGKAANRCGYMDFLTRRVHVRQCRFLFDGQRVDGTHTPATVSFGVKVHHCRLHVASGCFVPLDSQMVTFSSLNLLINLAHTRFTLYVFPMCLQHGMEDNDVIDCMIEQLGGSC